MQPATRPAISASVSGVQHDERVLDPPVGGVGHVRDAATGRRTDVVLRGDAAEHARRRACAGRQTARNCARERGRPPRARAASSSPTVGVALAGVGGRRAPLLDLAQAVLQRVDQQPAPARVVEQVVLQIGVALHHPDVAQHLVQHARRAAGLALAAQPVQQLPGARAEQADHDLAVGERGVVVGDLAQPRRGRGDAPSAAAMRVSGSGAFMAGVGAAWRRQACARHRTAAQQSGLAAPRCRSSRRVYPACLRRPAAR